MRQEAEARLPTARPAPFETDGDPVRLLHELQVHQIELEMQNDELRRAQVELEEGRNLYWALYDHAPFGYLALGPDGAILDANPAATRLLGVDRQPLIGRRLSSFMDHADGDRFFLHQRAAAASQTTQTCDVALRRSDGRVIQSRLETACEIEGEVRRFQTVIVNITDIRQAEEQLKESETRFRQLAQHVEDVFYVGELDGRISYVSPAFERIWGRPADWLAGRPSAWLETVDPEDRGRIASAWARLRAGATISEAYRIRRPDGTARWVHSRGFPVATDDGRLLRTVGVIRDVTGERALEDQLRHAQKMEAVGALASGVAHNLRNVLQAVGNSIEVARLTAAQTPESGDALARALRVIRTGAELIDQLMIFARKQEGETKLRPMRVDDSIREAEALLRPLVGGRIVLEIGCDAPAGMVMADPVQIEQVLLNLAANARDAMPDGGRLAIRSREAVLDEPTATAHGIAPGPHVIVTVEDSGCGMDPETKARAFEPFFTTKGVGKGTGLGLSTVFAVIRQIGGCIEIESEPGRGTRFSIFLPSMQIPIVPAGEARA